MQKSSLVNNRPIPCFYLGWNLLGPTQGWLYQVLPVHWSHGRERRTQAWAVPSLELGHILWEQWHNPSRPPWWNSRQYSTKCSGHGEYQLKVDNLHHSRARARRILQDWIGNKDWNCLDSTINNWPHPNQTSCTQRRSSHWRGYKLVYAGLAYPYRPFKSEGISDSHQECWWKDFQGCGCH